ncbi:HEL024Cp [Eremothecium sinecaudum]|uniref:HEL024Cp n=1 Tax=Eremothecium sinecaudum TaxID=45286 RepID=A0A109UXF7_9SACH|nr:HEL024Cp [Eremothecium sinecaudum]AMD21256.1 HEL024Cp [Eremothecium sinecaudum]
MSATTQGATTTSSSAFLANIIGKPVNVKLHSGMLYQGTLESIDGFMNVALIDAVEYYETENSHVIHKYDSDIFLRGTQVMYISEL